MLTLTTSTIVEFIGFCARASATNQTGKLMPFIIQSAFILLPPTLYAATIYMCLGRIIGLLHGDHLSPIRSSRLTKTFVGGDILSFLVQGGSAGLSAVASTNPTFGTIGQALVIAGLGMQLISFCVFGLTAIVFHTRFRKAPTPRSYQVDRSWIKTMYMLYGVSSLIIVRSIFRIIEYVLGTGSSTGYLLTNEWTLYVFDTIPMLVVAGLFFWRYPDNLMPGQSAEVQLESQVSSEHVFPSKGYS